MPTTSDKNDLRSVSTGRFSRILTAPAQMQEYVHGLSQSRLDAAASVSQIFRFRVPLFYVEKVLSGEAADPLVDLVFPSEEELSDGPELWDSTASPFCASTSPFWVQKYPYQGLVRLTTTCSGLCRFCYLKRKNADPATATEKDIDRLFDDLELRGGSLREIILSGGDPLCAPANILDLIARRMIRLTALRQNTGLHLAIHTREPVWNPVRLIAHRPLLSALGALRVKAYMINILHPREVTDEFVRACAAIFDSSPPDARPVFLCQHPVFKGVNDSVEILEDLYLKLMSLSPPVIPYYMVHPFYNGTLPRHRLGILDSQRLLRELGRRPGCMTPRLVVPTPWGKCQIGPYEQLRRQGDAFLVTTKNGQTVTIP